MRFPEQRERRSFLVPVKEMFHVKHSFSPPVQDEGAGGGPFAPRNVVFEAIVAGKARKRALKKQIAAR